MIMHTRVHTHPRTHTQKLTMPTLLTLIQVTYMMSPMFSFIKKRCRFDVFIQLSKLISIIDCLYSFLESLMEQNKGAGWWIRESAGPGDPGGHTAGFPCRRPQLVWRARLFWWALGPCGVAPGKRSVQEPGALWVLPEPMEDSVP